MNVRQLLVDGHIARLVASVAILIAKTIMKFLAIFVQCLM